jgi:hypothetical protein
MMSKLSKLGGDCGDCDKVAGQNISSEEVATHLQIPTLCVILLPWSFQPYESIDVLPSRVGAKNTQTGQSWVWNGVDDFLLYPLKISDMSKQDKTKDRSDWTTSVILQSSAWPTPTKILN